VDVDLCYTTRTFRRRPGDLQGDMAAVLAPMPPKETRVGFILAMEGDRWIVSIGGFGGDQAPTNPQGFLAFSRTLSRPDIYEVIRDAEPLTDALMFRFRASVRRRYENLARFPEQYLVIGDAICSFNPFYGQGMSVAALEGLALRDCLAAPHDTPLWSLFFGAAARVVDTPWRIASGSDFASTVSRASSRRVPTSSTGTWRAFTAPPRQTPTCAAPSSMWPTSSRPPRRCSARRWSCASPRPRCARPKRLPGSPAMDGERPAGC
jgi:hypothetical protein